MNIWTEDVIALPTPRKLHPHCSQRAIGALLGSAVGDALGAPFEFDIPNRYNETFPNPVFAGIGEMQGGGNFGWRPGEFTDDTQMAIALANSIMESGGMSSHSLWEHFVAWKSDAKDVGILTRSVLSRNERELAAQEVHSANGGKSAANGALMRVTPIPIAWAYASEDEVIEIARRQSSVTHHDPAAGWGAAIGAAMIYRGIHGDDPIASIESILSKVDEDERVKFSEMLDANWHPSNEVELSNGTVWTCLAQAVWAVRTTNNFEDAVVTAINLGGDTDTVACVAGAIAGAKYSVQAIPSRWLTYLNGGLATPNGKVRHGNRSLQDLARNLLQKNNAVSNPSEHPAGPIEVANGVYAANLFGAKSVSKDVAVLSFCMTGEAFAQHNFRREFYLIDRPDPANVDIVSVLNDAVETMQAYRREGIPVLVHCHGGRSRTGVVLKAWAMSEYEMTEREAHAWLSERWPLYSDYEPSFIDALNELAKMKK